MKRQTIWTLLLAGAAALAGAGAASALDVPAAAVPDCANTGASDINYVADVHQDARQETDFQQRVDVDDDDVLLAIALANNGATDIDWNTIRSVEMTRTAESSARRIADLDREDVFSALALGVTASGGSLDALACVSDVEVTNRVTEHIRRDVDLDENNVLLAIALSNSIGGDLRFNDIADINEWTSASASHDRQVDVDRQDTFLALALGAGGSGGF